MKLTVFMTLVIQLLQTWLKLNHDNNIITSLSYMHTHHIIILTFIMSSEGFWDSGWWVWYLYLLPFQLLCFVDPWDATVCALTVETFFYLTMNLFCSLRQDSSAFQWWSGTYLWMEKFRTVATNRKPVGMLHSIKTPGNTEGERQAINANPLHSVCCHYSTLNISDWNVRIILHSGSHFHPYKMVVVLLWLGKNKVLAEMWRNRKSTYIIGIKPS